MKKIISAFLAVMLIFSLCACGDTDSKELAKGSATVDDVINSQINAENSTAAPTPTPSVSEDQEYVSEPDPNVDIDLTALSSTAVYAEVYNMLMTPEDYIDKTVKMKGAFSYYHDETTDVYYFACIIADATACCSQGIEFALSGSHSYPDDYPEVGDEICVTGTFSTYYEGENMYCTLKDAVMEIC